MKNVCMKCEACSKFYKCNHKDCIDGAVVINDDVLIDRLIVEAVESYNATGVAYSDTVNHLVSELLHRLEFDISDVDDEE